MGGSREVLSQSRNTAHGGVNAPNDVKHGKPGTEAIPVGEEFLGGCSGPL